MGVTIKAMLAYGYRLKTDDEGWLVHPDSPGIGEEYDDETATNVLLTASGHPLADLNTMGYHRRREALLELGVELAYSGYETSDLLLIAKGSLYEAQLSEATVVTPGGMVVQSGQTVDERLRWAVEELGLRPLQEAPAWLLTAYRF